MESLLNYSNCSCSSLKKTSMPSPSSAWVVGGSLPGLSEGWLWLAAAPGIWLVATGTEPKSGAPLCVEYLLHTSFQVRPWTRDCPLVCCNKGVKDESEYWKVLHSVDTKTKFAVQPLYICSRLLIKYLNDTFQSKKKDSWNACYAWSWASDRLSVVFSPVRRGWGACRVDLHRSSQSCPSPPTCLGILLPHTWLAPSHQLDMHQIKHTHFCCQFVLLPSSAAGNWGSPLSPQRSDYSRENPWSQGQGVLWLPNLRWTEGWTQGSGTRHEEGKGLHPIKRLGGVGGGLRAQLCPRGEHPSGLPVPSPLPARSSPNAPVYHLSSCGNTFWLCGTGWVVNMRL